MCASWKPPDYWFSKSTHRIHIAICTLQKSPRTRTLKLWTLGMSELSEFLGEDLNFHAYIHTGCTSPTDCANRNSAPYESKHRNVHWSKNLHHVHDIALESKRKGTRCVGGVRVRSSRWVLHAIPKRFGFFASAAVAMWCSVLYSRCAFLLSAQLVSIAFHNCMSEARFQFQIYRMLAFSCVQRGRCSIGLSASIWMMRSAWRHIFLMILIVECPF